MPGSVPWHLPPDWERAKLSIAGLISPRWGRAQYPLSLRKVFPASCFLPCSAREEPRGPFSTSKPLFAEDAGVFPEAHEPFLMGKGLPISLGLPRANSCRFSHRNEEPQGSTDYPANGHSQVWPLGSQVPAYPAPHCPTCPVHRLTSRWPPRCPVTPCSSGCR